MEPDDEHYCIKCGDTIRGIERYVEHRKTTCLSVNLLTKHKQNPKSDQDASNVVITKDNDTSKVIQANDFFSSLELQSSANVCQAQKFSATGILTRSKSAVICKTKKSMVVKPIASYKTKQGFKVKKVTIPKTPKASPKFTPVKKLNRKQHNEGGKESRVNRGHFSTNGVPLIPATSVASVAAVGGSRSIATAPVSSVLSVVSLQSMVSSVSSVANLAPIVSSVSSVVSLAPIVSSVSSVVSLAPIVSSVSSAIVSSAPTGSNTLSAPTVSLVHSEEKGPHGYHSPAKRFLTISPILTPEELTGAKDEEVEKLFSIGVGDDYYYSLDTIEDFSHIPPKTHTGGKWKAGGLTMTSPTNILWPKHAWETLLDEDRHVDEDEDKMSEGRGKFVPPSHTGGKWKPSQSGGKWTTSQFHSTKLYSDIFDGEDGTDTSPPSTHTRGKWIPSSGKNQKTVPSSVVASCQNSSGKCLKTSGGMVRYFCSPCNRRLSSLETYVKHSKSVLHQKRLQQDSDFEIKLTRDVQQINAEQRHVVKREIRLPKRFSDEYQVAVKAARREVLLVESKTRRRRSKRNIFKCTACRTKMYSSHIGKHLVSYYHKLRTKTTDPDQVKLILDNMHAIVKQSPFQCALCKFYCNSHNAFKTHWKSELHRRSESTLPHTKFWCSFCKFRCKDSSSMELHFDSNMHREVIFAVNNSIPIIIRQVTEIPCTSCPALLPSNHALKVHLYKKHAITQAKNIICGFCPFKTSKTKALQTHMVKRHHSLDLLYYCILCGVRFDDRSESLLHRRSKIHRKRALRRHQQLSQSRDFDVVKPCSYCKERFDSVDELRAHVAAAHPTLMPKCTRCGQIFSLPHDVGAHIRENVCTYQALNESERVKYECSLCQMQTVSQADFLVHLSKHEQVDSKVKCPVCHKLFHSRSIRVHVRLHTMDQPYQCSICGQKFHRTDMLTHHFIKDHTTDQTNEKQGKAGYSCKKCKFHSANTKGLQAHVACHLIETPPSADTAVPETKVSAPGTKDVSSMFTCSQPNCLFLCRTKGELKSHSQVHSSFKRFHCAMCTYSFKAKSSFQRHLLTHSSFKAFQCSHCEYKGFRPSDLTRHTRLHTGSKPFKCPHCDYRSTTIENLRKHVINRRRHVNMFLYECSACDYKTNFFREYKYHCVRTHPGQHHDMKTLLYDPLKDKPKTDAPVTAKPKKTRKLKARSADVGGITQAMNKYVPIQPKPEMVDDHFWIDNPNLYNIKKTYLNVAKDKEKKSLVEEKKQITQTLRLVPIDRIDPDVKPVRVKLIQAAQKVLKGSDVKREPIRLFIPDPNPINEREIKEENQSQDNGTSDGQEGKEENDLELTTPDRVIKTYEKKTTKIKSEEGSAATLTQSTGELVTECLPCPEQESILRLALTNTRPDETLLFGESVSHTADISDLYCVGSSA